MRFELDESQKKRVTRAFSELRNDAKNIVTDADAEALGRRFAKVAKAVGLPRTAVMDLQGDIEDLGLTQKQLANLTAGFVDVYRAADRAGKEINDLSKVQIRQQRFDDVSRNVGLAGDVQSNLGALNALTGGGLGPVGEVVALFEELPRLKTAIAGLPQVAAQAAATLGPVGIAIGVAVAAVGLAIGELVRQANEQAQQLQNALNASREVGQKIAEGLTTEEAQRQIEELIRKRDQEAEELAKQEAAYQSMTEQLGILTGAVQLFDNREEALASTIDDTRNSVQTYNAQIRALETAISSGELAANDAAGSEDDLARAREAAAAATDQVAQLESQLAQSQARYNQDAADRAVDDYNRRLDEQEDFNEARSKRAVQHQRQLAGIQEAGNKRIQALQDELASLPLKRAKELADAERNATDERRKVLQDYADDSRKDAEDLARDLAKIEKNGIKERRRIIEDAQQSINEAAGNLDAKALLEAEAARDTALKRSVEDQNDTVQEQTQNFEVERQRAREALQARLADIQQSLQKEQQSIRESYAQRRTELKQALDEEKAQLRQAIIDAQTAFIEREREIDAERQKQQARRARDEQIAEQRRQRAFQQELNTIQMRLRAILSEVQATRQLEAAASRLQATINSLRVPSGYGGTSSSSNSQAKRRTSSKPSYGSSSRGAVISAFADGGVVTRPQLAYVGEGGQPEAIIPFNRSEGLAAALQRFGGLGDMGPQSMGTVIINLNGDVLSTEFVTRGEVLGGFRKLGEHIQTELIDFAKTARRGKKVS